MWIDQLCINQKNLNEKSRQVDLMRTIYREGSRCVIWFGNIRTSELGFTLEDGEGALDIIRNMARGYCGMQSNHRMPFAFKDQLDPTMKAFRAFIMDGNSWWSRIWTVQEAVLPVQSTVFWGPLQIEWEDLAQAALDLCTGNHYHRVDSADLGFWDKFTAPIRGLDIAKQGENPLNMLHRWRYRDATDHLDKVYALVGLFPSSPFPNITSCRYDISVAMLYSIVTYDLITTENSFRALVGRGDEPHMTPGLPCWALDLVRCPDSTKRPWKWWNHSHRYQQFEASSSMTFACGTNEDYTVLALKGIIIDSVDHIGEVLLEGTWGDISDEHLASLISSWERLYNSKLEKGMLNAYGDQKYAFWSTLIGQLIMAEFPARYAQESDGLLVEEFRTELVRNEVYMSLRDMIVNQAFFITRQGYIGIAPPTIERGDDVCVLAGGNVPFVLRPKVMGNGLSNQTNYTSRAYSFVGNAFVYGIMFGEAVTDSRDAIEDFMLY